MNRSRHELLTFAEIFELPLALNVHAAALALGVSRSTVYRRIKDGALPLPVIRLGRRYIVPTAPVLRALGIEQRPVDPADVRDGTEASASWQYADHEQTED